MSESQPPSSWRDRIGVTWTFAAFVVVLLGLPLMLAYTVREQTRSESLANARAISELMLQFRRYYNLNIVARLQQGEHPITVTDQYKDIKGAIPIPATMSIEVATLLTDKIPNSPFDFGFTSDQPFKGRNRPALDHFQRDALEAFRAKPELEEFWREDRTATGASALRLAIPVKMQKACVDCHNSHPDSTFRFWKVGDVRGVQDVSVRHSISPSRHDDFLYLGAYLLVFVTLLVMALNEYRRKNLSLKLLNEEQVANRLELERQRHTLVEQMDELLTKTTVLDKAPFGVVIADPHQPDMPVVYVNEAFTRITGYSARELLGRNCRILQGPETEPAAIDRIRQSLQARELLDIEILNYRRDGQPFYNRLQLFPCKNAAGELISYVSCSNDVTQLKQTEAERERLAAELQESLKLESLGLTIAGMAHDLNTPIGIALTASTHLNRTVRQMRAVSPEEAVPAEQVGRWAGSLDRAIELVAGNLQKAAELVRSFKQTTIDASRVEWRKLALRPFFESLVTSVSPLMKRSQCSIHVECPPSLEVTTEPGSLSQVVMNLLVNATLHAFDGRSDRQIRIVVQDSEDQILIEVVDNGNGMSEEALSKAFMPFFTTKRGAGGSGLGLFSSRRVVEQTLGGRIQVHSAAGQGTSFRIQLPKNRSGAT